jgi:hypothetical protein
LFLSPSLPSNDGGSGGCSGFRLLLGLTQEKKMNKKKNKKRGCTSRASPSYPGAVALTVPPYCFFLMHSCAVHFVIVLVIIVLILLVLVLLAVVFLIIVLILLAVVFLVIVLVLLMLVLLTVVLVVIVIVVVFIGMVMVVIRSSHGMFVCLNKPLVTFKLCDCLLHALHL